MIERYSRPEMKRVWSEENKFGKWLDIEIAVCDAWTELGIIPRNAMNKIKLAKCNLKRMNEILQETRHDMTAFIGSVSESLGDESRFIHLGLTSSDVMDTATSLQLVEASDILMQDIKELTAVLAQRALEHKYTLTIGRTHGVHAEPTTFGLKLAIWVEEMRRNLHRLSEAKKIICVGKISGAVGTYATVPPEIEQKACRKLGLEAAPISNQVLQRDRHAQFVTTLAVMAGSLEKFATEIRNLQRTELMEAEEHFAKGQKGSSAMPHKRNPLTCERVAGLARVMRGYSVAAQENVALWHERDITHSSAERIILPDSTILLNYMLEKFIGIMEKLNVYPERMKRNIQLTRGLVSSQQVLLGLVGKGITREKAYAIVQRNALNAWQNELDFKELIAADPDVRSKMTRAEIEKCFDLSHHLKNVDFILKRAGII